MSTKLNHVLKFSRNWNNNLKSKAFAWLLLHDNDKYVVGDTYDIVLRGKQLGKAKLVDKSVVLLDKINDFAAYLVTGYDTARTVDIIKRIYKDLDIDRNNQYLDFCCFVYQE